MESKKGQALPAVIGTVITLVIGVILLVGVLTPIATNLTKAPYFYNGTGSADIRNVGFSGAQGALADSVITFILIGVLLLVIGVGIAKFNA